MDALRVALRLADREALGPEFGIAQEDELGFQRGKQLGEELGLVSVQMLVKLLLLVRLIVQVLVQMILPIQLHRVKLKQVQQ